MPPKKGKKAAAKPKVSPSSASEEPSKSKRGVPTISQILQDPITEIASKYWAPGGSGEEYGVFDDRIVQHIYRTELCSGAKFDRLQLLEFSCYLENYLWKYLSPESSFEHVFSVLLMINEKFREGVGAFDSLTECQDKFQDFLSDVVKFSILEKEALNAEQKTSVVVFLINSFKSLENEVVRRGMLKYVSLPIWESLTEERLRAELDEHPQIRQHWEYLQSKKDSGVQSESVANAESDDENTTQGKRKNRRRSKTPTKKAKTSTTPPATPSIQETKYMATWFSTLLDQFMNAVEDSRCASSENQTYIERFCELLIDLLSQLPTRRFLNTLLDDRHIIVRCKRSVLYSPSECTLFTQLVDLLDAFSNFQIEDQSGRELSAQDMMAVCNSRLHTLQQVAYMHYKEELADLIFSSTGELGKAENLQKHFSLLSEEQLLDLAHRLGYITAASSPSTDFVMDVLLFKLSYRKSQLELLSQTSLYPTEKLLWDPNSVPLGKHYNGQQVLALPKLNLQFLTMHDYFLRNFNLFRLESAYEIRQDIVDSVKRIAPRQSLSGSVSFGGWARMALPIISVNIEEVTKPNLGEVVPGRVSCSVEIDISRYQGDIRDEWEALREHDVVFLLCIKNPAMEAGNVAKFENERKDLAKGQKPKGQRDFQWSEDDLDFPSTYGIQYVRAGEIFEYRDEDDVVLNDFTRPDERKTGRIGGKRRLRLRLDPAQYYEDVKSGVECYETLNLLIRRKPKENNFKAVLETIRDLMNTAAVGRAIPAWLHDVFLGYGRPDAAHYRNMPTKCTSRQLDLTSTTESCQDSDAVEEMDYTDTFLSYSHLLESFPDADVSLCNEDGVSLPVDNGDPSTHPLPPFKLRITRGEGKDAKDVIQVFSYRPVNMGPFPQDKRPCNSIRYTSVQVEALRSGMNQGLTMVVGPPGTGKTDVAVQIICNLYHNYPTQKILLVAHSNTALNDLFEKIMMRDVDPRHLLRLGSGEKDLLQEGRGKDAFGSEDQFSKQGRVNWSLARRQQLLQQVQYLAVSLGVAGDVGYTCETAEYFNLEHIVARIEKFQLDVEAMKGDENEVDVQSVFPFTSYFSSAPQPLFKGDYDQDVEIAAGCFRHIKNLFAELADYRAFELLRTQGHRADYLLTKQARIVAMTCTHAAMTRRRLVELGFKYDSMIMEEAAQVLEIETLIPMLLQNTDSVDGCRLKRVVLIGDHYQLPPVVKHPAFQRYSRLDQSMFSRLVRLGVPYIQLDKQGRARPEIASLYSWRYNKKGGPHESNGLGNLPVVQNGGNSEYRFANAGFTFPFQLIDVPAFQGKGEFCPTPYFYQNLGEAEYVVAVYQYMRLIGYPAEKISILSTYNGQKHLIRDIISQRCKNPVFGRPSAVTTVDKFQGQQNDYILLSLVRTESVGHLRDIRRLVVAASRARLGLYVFCRQELFENCYELSPTFAQLLSRPPLLSLVLNERYPTSRPVASAVPNPVVTTVENVTSMGVLVYKMTQEVMQSQQAATLTAVLPSSESTPMEVEDCIANENTETAEKESE